MSHKVLVTALIALTAIGVSATVCRADDDRPVRREIVFSDNFDKHPDWWPACLDCGCTNKGCSDKSNARIPAGWTYWRNDELWNPYAPRKMTPGSHPTIQISSENHYGSGGKAFTVWNESNRGTSGDGWGADGILAKKLDREYRELTAEAKIKFQDGFKWFWTPDQMAGVLKIFRVYHYDGGKKSPFKYFADGASAPMYIFDLSNKEAPWGFRAAHSLRCKPQATNYSCSPNYDSPSSFDMPLKAGFEKALGDGSWHRLKWQVVMNSVPGAPDGELRFWADGRLLYERTDLKWLGPGSPHGIGWNMVALGGNAYNTYADPALKREQWYALDDLTVSTAGPGSTSDEEKETVRNGEGRPVSPEER